jgi:AAHS family 4-hydroxybenzoate transporter-like MFS transporter
MQAELSAAVAVPAARLHLWVAWLCGVVLFLEGYDIAAVGYAVPSLVDAWKVQPSVFTTVLTAGNVGLMLGSLCAGLLGDRLGRKPVLMTCVVTFGIFSLLSAFVGSLAQLESLRFLTGLGLGGGLPLALALASGFVPPESSGRLVILMCAGVPIGFSVGGLLASWLVGLFGWRAIFVTGGVLPLTVVPLLALWLPESIALRAVPPRRNLAAALFQNGLAPSTVLLWAINVLSLVGTFFILLWTPAILHSTGATPSQAILATTIYALGIIASPLLAALIVDHVGIEPVLACGLAFGALCILAIGLFYPRFWLLSMVLCGAGIGGGCQAGINSLSALAYPPAIRSTGAGWALGAGRAGAIGGVLLGGALLALGFRAQKLFVAASIPAFGTALLMAILGRLRRKKLRLLD